jgi:hypothetical protein
MCGDQEKQGHLGIQGFSSLQHQHKNKASILNCKLHKNVTLLKLGFYYIFRCWFFLTDDYIRQERVKEYRQLLSKVLVVEKRLGK